MTIIIQVIVTVLVIGLTVIVLAGVGVFRFWCAYQIASEAIAGQRFGFWDLCGTVYQCGMALCCMLISGACVYVCVDSVYLILRT